MGLRPNTVETLKRCTSIHAPHGFQTVGHIKRFWEKHGATGFLNIREVTPQMVHEIRIEIIEAKRPND